MLTTNLCFSIDWALQWRRIDLPTSTSLQPVTSSYSTMVLGGDGTDVDVRQLLAVRRSRKGVITKFLGNTECEMAERDVDAVRDRLQKLKEAFRDLEASHDLYHETLTEDADIDTSEQWFRTVQNDYKRGVDFAHQWLDSMTVPNIASASAAATAATVSAPVTHKSNDSDTVNADTLHQDLVNVLNVPRLEIDKFSGDPMQYQTFMNAFDDLVDSHISEGRVKLTRLLQYTDGPAKLAIQNCALVSGEKGYRRARWDFAHQWLDSMTVPNIASASAAATAATVSAPVTHKSNDSDTVNADTLHQDLVNVLNVPPLEIDKFSGDPMQYQTFMNAFDDLVDSHISEGRVKLTRLLQYTDGPAKLAIQNCALVSGEKGYRRARWDFAHQWLDSMTVPNIASASAAATAATVSAPVTHKSNDSDTVNADTLHQDLVNVLNVPPLEIDKF